MRRASLATPIALAAALLAVTAWAARSAAGEPGHPAPAAQPAPAMHQHQHTGQASPGPGDSRGLATQLARARLATARYATDLRAAKADGYQIITRMMPDMGWHFLNPNIQGFDVTRPPILVYERHGRSWQLGALEWVFPMTPTTPPLPGASYGLFGAACHYTDGTFVPRTIQEHCPGLSPETGAAFNFWHPDLVTLHVWLWYPNPAGLYSGTNPYIQPFNRG
jgi:hypothetical protein